MKAISKIETKNNKRISTVYNDSNHIKNLDKKKKDNDEKYSLRTESNSKSQWNFITDYNDHFETPKIAYLDLKPFIESIAHSLNKTIDQIVIYDPYYCQGNMIKFLVEIGCSINNIINHNRDFYIDIESHGIPNYDILITNPPYSGDHKLKLLNFLQTSKQPFALLLPAYTATKSYWKDFITTTHSNYDNVNGLNSNISNKNNISNNSNTNNKNDITSNKYVFYILPPDYYMYSHPENTGKDIPPFYSMWFIGHTSYILKQR